MKVEELRVGNYVFPLDQGREELNIAHKVTLITRTYAGVTFTTEVNRAYSEIKPIPLDEEWFNKLGFKWGYDSTGDKAFCKGFYGVDYEGYATYRDTVLDCKIIYVHQLQNLYYALTGEELTVNEI